MGRALKLIGMARGVGVLYAEEDEGEVSYDLEVFEDPITQARSAHGHLDGDAWLIDAALQANGPQLLLERGGLVNVSLSNPMLGSVEVAISANVIVHLGGHPMGGAQDPIPLARMTGAR